MTPTRVGTRISIMHQYTGVGDVVGMEIGDFKVIGSLRLGKLFARNAFLFDALIVIREHRSDEPDRLS